MNIRSNMLVAALTVTAKNSIADGYRDLNVLEVGCMYKEDEGLSTQVISEFLKGYPRRKKFVSIEYERKNIEAAKRLLGARNPTLLTEVTFYHEHSLTALPTILQEMQTIDFAYLDGGAHPEVCLQEFEMLLRHLSDDGIILVDDVHDIGPSNAYPSPRPFGKATLILPLLTLNSYMNSREQFLGANCSNTANDREIPDSYLLSLFDTMPMANLLGNKDFRVYSCKGHAMLAVGEKAVLAEMHLRIDKNSIQATTVIPAFTTNEPEETRSSNQNATSTKQSQLLDTVLQSVKLGDFDTAIYAVHEIIEHDPFHDEANNLWKQIDEIRKNNGLPYMFPAGLGRAMSVDGIYGLLTEGDLRALRFAAEHAHGVSVNIGVFNGLSSYVIAKANPSLQVFGIDAFRGLTTQNSEINLTQKKIAEQNLARGGNAKLLVGLSDEIAQTWHGKIGFLFIDGNHLVEGAVSDFELWSSFVENGGFIAVHDSYGRVSSSVLRIRERHNSHGPDVVCAIMADDPRYEFVLADGSIQVWKKRASSDTADIKKDMMTVGSFSGKPENERKSDSIIKKDGIRIAKFCAETCIVFVSFGRAEIAARSYASLADAVAPYRDRIRIIISDATDDVQKFEWARATDADDIIFTPRFTPAATSRNLATSLILDKYAPKYLCMLEDDFEYQREWYPSLVNAAENLYGTLSPFGLAYGIFSACDHHIPAERMAEDPANDVTAYLFGAVAYQRFMPSSHYIGVMRGWDPDLLGISYAQTGGQTFRNTMRGFCGAVLPGHLSRPIDSDSTASTWSKGKRDPGPPAHSFVVQDYDVIRNAVIKLGTYARNKK